MGKRKKIRSENINVEESEDEDFKINTNDGESTPVLSDINDIDHHLNTMPNAQSMNISEYDSDIQSEMSATPQPTDMQRSMIQTFAPNLPSVTGMTEIKESHSLHKSGSRSPTKTKKNRHEIAND